MPEPVAISEGSVRRARNPRRSSPVSPLNVLGELLLTIGIVALLYVSWHMWVGDLIVASQQHAEADALSQQWAAAPDEPTGVSAGGSAVPVPSVQDHGDVFAIMRVPRFGADWKFNIASGVSRPDILDEGEIGHYPNTALPGEVGNTAYAAHRWTSGAAFDPIDRLVVGDAIVIETAAGWYTYRFRTLEYVQDSQVQVLLPVPNAEGLEANGRYLTLTSCAPKLNMLERIVAYAVFDEFTPRSDGPPESLAHGVDA